MRMNGLSKLFVMLVCSTIYSVDGFVPMTKQQSTSLQQRQHESRMVVLSMSSQQQSEEAKKLLEKAAEIRKQLAELEGKTIEQVEQEAKDKKELKDKASLELITKTTTTKETNDKEVDTDGRFLYVPENSEDQIRQAAAAIERAFRDGKKRQTVRLTLVKDGESIASEAVEEWPGGAKQMYRESGRPLSEDLLKQIRLRPSGVEKDDMLSIYSMPPKTDAQDIYDFDGSAIITTTSENPKTPVVKAMVFPNTDVKYLDELKVISNSDDTDLSLLINPFWRNVESWGFNILAPRAKQKAQEVVYDAGYGEETYVVSRFSARGERVVALKVYPYDWQLFAYLEEENWGIPIETAVRLGSSKEEPTSAMFTELLNARPEFKMSRNMRNINKLL